MVATVLFSVYFHTNENMWSFVSDLFHLIKCFQVSWVYKESTYNFCLLIIKIPLYGHILFLIHSSAGRILGCFHSWLLWMMLLWIFVYKFLYVHMLSISLGMYLGVELLGLMVIPCWTFQVLPNYFSRCCTIFTAPLAVYADFTLSTSSSTLISICLFYHSILVSMKWFRIVVSI
jgi:hypothetical protein